MKRLIRKNNNLNKTASYSNYSNFDSFNLDSGDTIAIGCRMVNNEPWYQEGLYSTSSYYDGPSYDDAFRMYKDLLTAFKGIRMTEKFDKVSPKIKEQINNLIENEKRDSYNFQRLKSDPLFLGVNNFEY